MMRRFAALLLALICLCSTTAQAASSNADIIDLYKRARESAVRCIDMMHELIDMLVQLGDTSSANSLQYLYPIPDGSKVFKPGIYQVGKDLAPGMYRFRFGLDSTMTTIRIGTQLNASKTDLVSHRERFTVFNPLIMFEVSTMTEGYCRVYRGDYIVVEKGDVRILQAEKQPLH